MWSAARMQKPVNFRWQKNMLAQVSIFGRDVKWDFFGAWQHSRDIDMRISPTIAMCLV